MFYLVDKCPLKYEKIIKRDIHFIHDQLAIKRDSDKLESSLRNKDKNSIL